MINEDKKVYNEDSFELNGVLYSCSVNTITKRSTLKDHRVMGVVHYPKSGQAKMMFKALLDGVITFKQCADNCAFWRD